ncbi:hypothetical protein V1477_007655, partial [Vespula maculifrons]
MSRTKEEEKGEEEEEGSYVGCFFTLAMMRRCMEERCWGGPWDVEEEAEAEAIVESSQDSVKKREKWGKRKRRVVVLFLLRSFRARRLEARDLATAGARSDVVTLFTFKASLGNRSPLSAPVPQPPRRGEERERKREKREPSGAACLPACCLLPACLIPAFRRTSLPFMLPSMRSKRSDVTGAT